MLNSKDNPPLARPEESPIDSFTGRWWVGHCKPRQEKALAWELARSGRCYFLPMYDKWLRSKGRRWRSRVVLFPGYLFLCGDEEARLAALATGRLVRTIEVADQARLAGELEGIRRMLHADQPVGPVTRFRPGTACRIIAGPLAGLEGFVDRLKGRDRFVLLVSMLGQGAAVEIDADQLEPA
ncbi:MAG: Transcription antitermination protein RfaH [Phycisphaerae bacterium]|nr:Transcription antitermination protein RfaH [Phycisphaerae bacterium]